MKLSYTFLIAASMITFSVNGFAVEESEEPKCACAAGEKQPETSSHHEEAAFVDTSAHPEDNFSCSDPAKCGALAKAAINEEANGEVGSGCKKGCDEEKNNCNTVICDDIFCRCFPLSLSHTEGEWIDNRCGYTSMNWFWPFPATSKSNYFPLVDVRAHVFNDGMVAANFGGGLRMVNGCNCETIIGANAFYDLRTTACSRYFQQLGVGFEVLNPCVDFRVNGYFPFGREHGCLKSGHKHCVNGKFTFRERKRVLTGFDASLGKWIVKDACGVFDYYATLGVYAYLPRNHCRGFVGGEVRLRASLIRYLSLELRGGYDSVNGPMAQGTIAVYIPLGKSPCHCFTNSYLEDNCYLRERLCQPLLRQEIMAFERKRNHFHKVQADENKDK